MLKIILVCGVEFYLICEIFQRLTVTKWTCRLVYYQVSGETSMAVVVDWTFTLRGVDTLIH